jgi:tetratricopeptide (TPR) repeat protein
MDKIRAIFHLLRETVGRHCVNRGCKLLHKRVDGDVATCRECAQPLEPKTRVNWRLAAPLLILLVLLVATALYLAQGIRERRAAAREEALLSRAVARFQGELRDATQLDVAVIASKVQAEYRLTESQRKKVVDASREWIDRLPRALTIETEEKLEKVLRDVYGDGRISPEERKRLDQFAQEERIAPATLANKEEHLRSKLEASQQSVSRGQSDIRQAKYEEARLEFLRATESDPGNATAWANLGATNQHTGQTDEARACYERALRLDAGNWVAHYNLGLLLERGGDRNASFRHLGLALISLDKAPNERKAVVEDLLSNSALGELRKDGRFTTLLISPISLSRQPE